MVLLASLCYEDQHLYPSIYDGIDDHVTIQLRRSVKCYYFIYVDIIKRYQHET